MICFLDCSGNHLQPDDRQSTAFDIVHVVLHLSHRLWLSVGEQFQPEHLESRIEIKHVSHGCNLTNTIRSESHEITKIALGFSDQLCPYSIVLNIHEVNLRR